MLEEHYIMMKESVFQEDITILNAYAPNNRAAKREAKLIELQRRNRWIYYGSWRLQHPLSERADPADRRPVRIPLNSNCTLTPLDIMKIYINYFNNSRKQILVAHIKH
jgi:hypothetical protein